MRSKRTVHPFAAALLFVPFALQAQAADSSRASEVLRVKIEGSPSVLVTSLAGVGVDSVRLVTLGPQTSRTVGRTSIISVDRQTGVERNVLGGALAGAGLGAFGGWWGGPISWASAYAAVSTVFAVVGADAPRWPDFPQALSDHPVEGALIGAAVGAALGSIPKRTWVHVAEWDRSAREASAADTLGAEPLHPPSARGRHAKLGAEIGVVTGMMAVLAANSFNPFTSGIWPLRMGAIGAGVGALIGVSVH